MDQESDSTANLRHSSGESVNPALGTSTGGQLESFSASGRQQQDPALVQTFDNALKQESTELAWKMYDKLGEALVRVDNKAWIMVGLGGTTSLVIYNLTKDNAWLATWSGARLVVYICGAAIVAASLLLSLSVVFPRLHHRRHLKDGDRDNFVYFGELKRQDLEHTILLMRSTPSQQLTVLARQTRVIAKMAWWKYFLLQLSISCWVVGLLLILLSNRLPPSP